MFTRSGNDNAQKKNGTKNAFVCICAWQVSHARRVMERNRLGQEEEEEEGADEEEEEEADEEADVEADEVQVWDEEGGWHDF